MKLLKKITFLFFIAVSYNSYCIPYLKTWCSTSTNMLLPILHHNKCTPVSIIKINRNPQAWLGCNALKVNEVLTTNTYNLQQYDTLILDFGRNMVGYLNGYASDSAKIKIEPAEVIAELADTWEKFPAMFDNGYKPYRSWIPNDINISNIWRVNERLTFRYIRITVLKAKTGFSLKDIYCDEVSAIPLNMIKPLGGFSPKMQKIDSVSQFTLRNCIQEVFEDGPKRDRRLWLGDLRLEAMLDAQVFKSDSIVKRCLLLFAGNLRPDSLIASCIYNTSKGDTAEIGDEMIPDYALLFGSVLFDYYKNSNDLALLQKLYPIACNQVNVICNKWLNKNYVLEIPDNVWMFIDWSKDLDRQTAEQATLIYSVKMLKNMAEILNLKSDATKWNNLAANLQTSSLQNLYDKKTGLFVSGKQMQISVASQVWMILAGVVDAKQGAEILNRLNTHTNVIQPGTAYLVHHLVEAYLICNMDLNAYQIINNYWGGMIEKGADTFWEIYDPENAYKSPYNSHLFNSYCHAWSCTPAYFLRHHLYGPRLRVIDNYKK